MSSLKLKPISEVVTTRCFDTYLVEGPIFIVVVHPNAEVKYEDATENTEVAMKMAEGKLYPMLVDTRLVKSIDKEARDCFARKDQKAFLSAIALLASSPVSIMIGNFFIGLNKPAVPTKLFKDEEKAFKWLKKFSK